MPPKCVICKTFSDKALKRALHRFPTEILLKEAWINALSLNEDFLTLEGIYLCSDHFRESDFKILPSGARLLKPGSVPFRQQTQELKVNFFETCVIKTEDLEEDYDIKPIVHPSTNPIETIKIEVDESLSYVTETASEAETENDKYATAINPKQSSGEVSGTDKPLKSVTFRESSRRISSSSTDTASETEECEEIAVVSQSRDGEQFVEKIQNKQFSDSIALKRSLDLDRLRIKRKNKQIAELIKKKSRLQEELKYTNSLMGYLIKNNFIKLKPRRRVIKRAPT